MFGARVGLLSSARGSHKYTFKRHVARSRSNLLTVNFCIIVSAVNTYHAVEKKTGKKHNGLT